jgi:hypothetical protein
MRLDPPEMRFARGADLRAALAPGMARNALRAILEGSTGARQRGGLLPPPPARFFHGVSGSEASATR